MVQMARRAGHRKTGATGRPRKRQERPQEKTAGAGKSVLWGSIAAILITMVGLVLGSLLLDMGVLAGTQRQYVLLVMGISWVSIFVGSFITARMCRVDGFRYGFLTGVLYIIIRFLLSWLVNGNDLFFGNLLTEIVASLGMACLGALLGKKKN